MPVSDLLSIRPVKINANILFTKFFLKLKLCSTTVWVKFQQNFNLCLSFEKLKAGSPTYSIGIVANDGLFFLIDQPRTVTVNGITLKSVQFSVASNPPPILLIPNYRRHTTEVTVHIFGRLLTIQTVPAPEMQVCYCRSTTPLVPGRSQIARSDFPPGRLYSIAFVITNVQCRHLVGRVKWI